MSLREIPFLLKWCLVGPQDIIFIQVRYGKISFLFISGSTRFYFHLYRGSIRFYFHLWWGVPQDFILFPWGSMRLFFIWGSTRFHLYSYGVLQYLIFIFMRAHMTSFLFIRRSMKCYFYSYRGLQYFIFIYYGYFYLNERFTRFHSHFAVRFLFP